MPELSGFDSHEYNAARRPVTPDTARAIFTAIQWLDETKPSGCYVSLNPVPKNPRQLGDVMLSDANPEIPPRYYIVRSDDQGNPHDIMYHKFTKQWFPKNKHHRPIPSGIQSDSPHSRWVHEPTLLGETAAKILLEKLQKNILKNPEPAQPNTEEATDQLITQATASNLVRIVDWLSVRDVVRHRRGFTPVRTNNDVYFVARNYAPLAQNPLAVIAHIQRIPDSDRSIATSVNIYTWNNQLDVRGNAYDFRSGPMSMEESRHEQEQFTRQIQQTAELARETGVDQVSEQDGRELLHTLQTARAITN